MNHRLLAGVLCVLAAMPAVALVPAASKAVDDRLVDPERPAIRGEILDPLEPSVAGEAVRAFLERNGGDWSFKLDRDSARLTLGQGSGIPIVPGKGNSLSEPAGQFTPETLEPGVREFLERNRTLLMPTRGTLILDRESSSVRASGRLASLYFEWRVGDVPVEGATVFVRINSGNITQFGAPLVGPIDLQTTPSLDGDAALSRLMQHSGDAEDHVLRHEPELWIQPGGVDTANRTYRLVWKITYKIPGRLETWEGRVDAHSGDVVGFRDLNMYARAVGGVYPRTVFDDNEITAPLPEVDVDVLGTSVTTTASGSFPYAGGGISSGLNGRWFDVSCQGCSNPGQPGVGTQLGIGWIDFGTGGLDEQGNGLSTPADRNTFYHLNQVRRIGKKWLPSETWLDSTIVSNTNVNSTCNAIYDGAVNFYRSGGGCNNTGEISDVVHHEWGHGLDLNTQGGDGGTGEGTADVVAIHMSHSPQIGPGFRTTGLPVRDVDKAVTGLITLGNAGAICGGGSHCMGQVYGQSVWDLSQALVAKHGHHTGWRTSERLFFMSLPDAGTLDPGGSLPIYDAYLNADDDDGNLANGTPNAQEIFDAFDEHQIANAPVPTSPQCTRPQQPELTVLAQCDRFELSWPAVTGADRYEVLRGEAREDSAYFPIATLTAGETSFVDSDVAPGLDYWYVVLADDAADCESTVEMPRFARLSSQPVLTVVAAVDDDTPRGNRSGFADPGEEVDLVLTLTNVGQIDATSLSGTIVSTTPGVTIVEGASSWPTIPPDSTATNQGALRFETDDQLVACGDVLQFQLVPDEASGCSAEPSFFEVRLGEPVADSFVCDDTPACFVEPDFAGLGSASSGSSCAENILSWGAATSNCINATISFSIYRDTDPGFAPDDSNRIVADFVGSSYSDTLLEPGQVYHYVVRAFDSRSGEEANLVVKSAVASAGADFVAPVFGGIDALASGTNCGETILSWSQALETCNDPSSFVIYRSTDPAFVPAPENLIGSSFATSFVDAALSPGTPYTYIVRARDGVGNEEGNLVRFTADAGLLDLTRFETGFEPDDASWSVTAPNDAAAGNWAWGDPQATSYQPEDDAGDDGINCWITGLADGPGNDDVDDGTTTLLSATYSLLGTVNPAVRYARWFTNDRGSSPGNDPFLVEVSDDGGSSWVELETVGAGTPLEWVDVEVPLSGVITPSDKVVFRFTAADLGAGSLVEAGIDEFALVDLGQGCLDCATPAQSVGTIKAQRLGDDVVLDWVDDPVEATRFVVYALSGSTFGETVRVGTTETRTFVHEGAATAGGNFSYRVSAVDACGNESAFAQPLP